MLFQKQTVTIAKWVGLVLELSPLTRPVPHPLNFQAVMVAACPGPNCSYPFNQNHLPLGKSILEVSPSYEV